MYLIRNTWLPSSCLLALAASLLLGTTALAESTTYPGLFCEQTHGALRTHPPFKPGARGSWWLARERTGTLFCPVASTGLRRVQEVKVLSRGHHSLDCTVETMANDISIRLQSRASALTPITLHELVIPHGQVVDANAGDYLSFVCDFDDFREDGLNLYKYEVVHEPVTTSFARLSAVETYEIFDAVFEAQEQDGGWSGLREEAFAEAAKAVGEEGLAIDAIECRATICRIEAHGDGDLVDPFLAATAPEEEPGVQELLILRLEEGPEASHAIFVSRVGSDAFEGLLK